MFDNQQRAFIALARAMDPAAAQTLPELCLEPKMANRHGLITGATGTGKTVTLQTLAETFSAMGVPVFAADVKGDLSGVAAKGGNKDSVNKRVSEYGLMDKGFVFQAFPVQFWDVYGEGGVPVRAVISDLGPLLLARLLNLNDNQTSLLSVIFKIAADENLELVDLKDLRKTLEYAAANASDLSVKYGNIYTAGLGAIQRGLTALAQEGGDLFFGEPALNIADLIRSEGGKGIINILAADKLMAAPTLYACLLLWLLGKLQSELPEIGDPDKPKLVFFFDEAHLLFKDAPKALLDKVEQVVRLIRSKGVGVYFISQSPADIPDNVLGQLGNRVQHALRAYTPNDQKAVRAAARSFRANPAFDTEAAIQELETGEALVSFLDHKGAPQPVERAFILPPESQIGPLDTAARKAMLESSLIYRAYAQAQDRVSAYEKLSEKPELTMSPKEQAAQQRAEEKARKDEEKARQAAAKEALREERESKRFWTGMLKSVGAPLFRQVIGSLLKRK